MFQFDWTISVANIITASVVIGGWLYAFFQLKSDVRIIRHDQKNTDTKINLLTETISSLTSILTRVAVQDERLSGQEHRLEVCETDIREMQHGKGFVIESLSGEYSRQGKVIHK